MNVQIRIANYIARYAPSARKVREYLTKKNFPNPESLLQELCYNEELMIDMWMRTYLHLQKGRAEIRGKLLQKGFPKSLVDEKIESYREEMEDWDSYREKINGMIEEDMGKGKSILFIKQKLQNRYPYFRDEILSFLAKQEDSGAIQKELEKYRKRYNLHDPHERQKLIMALMRKGFRYDAIKHLIF